MSQFQKATRKQVKARIALAGPTGSGKSYTALVTATALAKAYNTKIAVIDTEKGSASLYSDIFDFDVVELISYSVENYLDAMHDAADAGYGVLVIDSLSHAWAGKDGLLEFVDKEAARSSSKNSYMAWRNATPLHNQLVDGMLMYPGHIIVTMRSKTAYEMQKDESTGKIKPVKIGMQPIQRDGIEYEFTITGDMDLDHTLIISKSRAASLADKVYRKPGREWTENLIAWLQEGEPPASDEKAPEKPTIDHMVNRIIAGEKLVHLKDDGTYNRYETEGSRKKHTDVTSDKALRTEVEYEKLKAYFQHIQAKYKELQAKKKEPTAA